MTTGSPQSRGCVSGLKSEIGGQKGTADGQTVHSYGNPSCPARHRREYRRESQGAFPGFSRGIEDTGAGRHVARNLLVIGKAAIRRHQISRVLKEELMRSARFLFLAAFIAVFLILTLAIPAASSAQEMSDQDKKMMEMMMKYGTPGKNHEILKKYVGDWDVETKSWPTPGAEPMTGKGSMNNELIFDGRSV